MFVALGGPTKRELRRSNIDHRGRSVSPLQGSRCVFRIGLQTWRSYGAIDAIGRAPLTDSPTHQSPTHRLIA